MVSVRKPAFTRMEANTPRLVQARDPYVILQAHGFTSMNAGPVQGLISEKIGTI